MPAFSVFDYLDSDASPRFGAWTIGGAIALTVAWFGLITAEQKSFYDPLCGSVSAAAADRYAECMSGKFSGRSATAEADLNAAMEHMLASRFRIEDRSADHGTVLEHKGALLALGKTPSRFFVGIEDGVLVVRSVMEDA